MKAIKVHGTKKKIRKLVELSKQAMREGAYRVANRLRAVAFNMEGKSAPVIAEILNVHRSKVSIWLQNWQKEGKDGILEGHRSGRPSCISQSQKRKLSEILDSGPVAYGFSSGVWTSPMVARVIEEEFSIAYHPAHVSRLLHGLGFSVQRPKKILAQADQAAQSRWIRYKYPNIKKKPGSKEQRSSSRTKQVSGKTPRFTEHGHE
ncbi:MAG: winged helix-turn-helix domain-containing protein [Bacteroidota bacterium]